MATDDRRSDRDGDDELMPRPAAAAYLSRRLGRPVTVKALCGLADRGSGPPFRVIMRRATYSRADLDAWIAEQMRRG